MNIYEKHKNKTYNNDSEFIEACSYIQQQYKKEVTNQILIFPYKRKNAKQYMKSFFKNRQKDFAENQDCICGVNNPIMTHSGLSPMINIGLINPIDIIKYMNDDASGLTNFNNNNNEAYIRQLISWRELQRYTYYINDCIVKPIKQNNIIELYECSTPITVLNKYLSIGMKYGYLHHIVRQMIIRNLLMLQNYSFDEIYKWCMDFSLDSYDWVMYYNVFLMGSSIKPYISSDNYITKMKEQL